MITSLFTIGDDTMQNRKSIRLQGFDYSHEGFYFITICTYNREWLLSNICATSNHQALPELREQSEQSNDTVRFLSNSIPTEQSDWNVLSQIGIEYTIHHEGQIIETELFNLQTRFPVKILDYVIMPDHLHFIIELVDSYDSNATLDKPEEFSPDITGTIIDVQKNAKSIGSIICAFKSITTKKINTYYHRSGSKIWQRNYFEHIIRSEADYLRIAEYIANNPINWGNRFIKELFS